MHLPYLERTGIKHILSSAELECMLKTRWYNCYGFYQNNSVLAIMIKSFLFKVVALIFKHHILK